MVEWVRVALQGAVVPSLPRTHLPKLWAVGGAAVHLTEMMCDRWTWLFVAHVLQPRLLRLVWRHRRLRRWCV